MFLRGLAFGVPIGGASGAAPADAPFLTNGSDASLTNETDVTNLGASGIAFASAAASSGTPVFLTFTPASHTSLIASVEVIDFNFNLAHTVERQAGSVTTQRAMVITAPTYSFSVGAATITTGSTLAISGTPQAGTNTTYTNLFGLQIGGAVTAGPTSAGFIYGVINIPAHTVTVTGTTQVTSVGPAGLRIGQITFTDASAATIDTASSLYVANAPVAAGSAVITSPYAIWVDAGNVRLDGAVGIGVSPDATVQLYVTQVVNASTLAPSAFAVIGGAHTTLTAGTAAIDINLVLARTVQFGTGAIAAQQAIYTSAPTYAFVGASTITTAVTFQINAAPTAGTNATFTNTYVAQLGGNVTIGATSASMLYGVIDIPAHTVTVTGTTGVTSVGPAGIRIGQITVSDASAVTIDTASSLYIANAPTGAGGGPAAITNAYAIWVDAGNIRVDGVVLGSAGSISAASYSVNGDPNNGIYFPAADQTAITNAGAQTYLWTATAQTVTQAAATSGGPYAFQIVGGAHTTLTAGTEAHDTYFNLSRTVQWATGALTTQRAIYVKTPTYGFVGASTLTTAVVFEINKPVDAGTNATITANYGMRLGSAALAAGPTSAGMLFSLVHLAAYTATVTGTTQVTSVGPSQLSIGQLTVTDSSSVTIDTAASLYIAAAPVAAGSVTITSAYAIWVDAGNVRLDGAQFASVGSVTAAAYSFHSSGTSDPNTGAYSTGADNFSIAAGGVQTASFSSSALTLVAGFSLVFASSTTTGLNNPGTGQISIVCQNSNVLRWNAVTLGTFTSNVTITQPISTGANLNALLITGGAHTTLTASTEAIDVYYDLSRTVQFATGALTTQRAFVVEAPTYGFVGASTVTNARTFVVDAAPTAGTNATFTTVACAQFGGAVTIGPTSAGLLYNVVSLPTHTVTVSGTTQVTSVGPAMLGLGILTLTNADTVTIDNAATLYIAGAPAAAGSVTITNKYAIWVDGGISRFDGNGSHVFAMSTSAAVAVVATRTIPILDGATTYYLMLSTAA